MDNPNAQELVNELGRYVNTFNMRDRTEDFIEAFDREHRTLQQSIFKLFLNLMEHMASDKYKTDARNQDSKDISKKIILMFQESYKKEMMDNGYSEADSQAYVDKFYVPSKFLNFI